MTLIQQICASLAAAGLYTLLHYAWANRKHIYRELTLNKPLSVPNPKNDQ